MLRDSLFTKELKYYCRKLKIDNFIIDTVEKNDIPKIPDIYNSNKTF